MLRVCLENHAAAALKDVPLAKTLESSLNSTTNIFPICPAILRVVVPDITSHRNTERSPPEDASLLLSCDLPQKPLSIVRPRPGARDDLHAHRKHLVPVCGERLYLRPQVRIP